MTIRAALLIALACWPGAAIAAAGEQRARIAVGGTGRVETPPDVATIAYGVRGEGTTSDAAVGAMVARRQAIDAGLAALTGAPGAASRVSVTEVRGDNCKRDDDAAPRLSTGACAVIGYIAEMETTVRTGAVRDAGTIVGLLGRLQATNPRLDGFALAYPEAAERRAMAAALVDARRRAEAIAAGTGVRLGRLLTATSGDRQEGGQDVVVTAQRRAAPAMPPPIAVELTPRPIETEARVTVTYEVAS